jgi:hypothetical protein
MSVQGIDINVDINWGKLSMDIAKKFDLNVFEVDKFFVDNIQDYFVTKLKGTGNGVLKLDEYTIGKK